MKFLLSVIVLSFSFNLMASDIVLRPDGNSVNINGAEVSCAREPLNISPSKLTDIGLYALALGHKLNKCSATADSDLVGYSNGSSTRRGRVQIIVVNEKSYKEVFYSAFGQTVQTNSDFTYEPTEAQIKQIGTVLRDLIIAGVCD